MHVISRKKIKEAAAQHSDLESPLEVWFRIAKRADWRSLADVRRTFSSADPVEKWTIFNVKGNQYWLITEINYRSQRIYIRHVLSLPNTAKKLGSAFIRSPSERKRR